MPRFRFLILFAALALALAAPAVARADGQPATPPAAAVDGFADGNGLLQLDEADGVADVQLEQADGFADGNSAPLPFGMADGNG